jgi:beta-fructofuranosidase
VHETFQVERPRPSNINPDINHAPEIAPHTLFTYTNPATTINDNTASEAETGSELDTEEHLRIHALFDSSVLEVFVNGRTAITTRIYHSGDRATDGPKCVGVQFFADAESAGCDADADVDSRGGGKEAPARLIHATIWDGLTCL